MPLFTASLTLVDREKNLLSGDHTDFELFPPQTQSTNTTHTQTDRIDRCQNGVSVTAFAQRVGSRSSDRDRR